MSDNTQKAKDAVQDVMDNVTDAAHDVKNKVDDAAHDAKNAAKDATHDAKKRLRTPLTTPRTRSKMPLTTRRTMPRMLPNKQHRNISCRPTRWQRPALPPRRPGIRQQMQLINHTEERGSI